MKKVFALSLSVAMLATAMTACSSDKIEETTTTAAETTAAVEETTTAEETTEDPVLLPPDLHIVTTDIKYGRKVAVNNPSAF